VYVYLYIEAVPLARSVWYKLAGANVSWPHVYVTWRIGRLWSRRRTNRPDPLFFLFLFFSSFFQKEKKKNRITYVSGDHLISFQLHSPYSLLFLFGREEEEKKSWAIEKGKKKKDDHLSRFKLFNISGLRWWWPSFSTVPPDTKTHSTSSTLRENGRRLRP